MKARFTILTLVFSLVSVSLMAQFKSLDLKPSDGKTIQMNPKSIPFVPANQNEHESSYPISLDKESLLQAKTKIQASNFDYDGMPIFFQGSLKEQVGKSIEDQTLIYLTFINQYFELRNIERSYELVDQHTDELGMQHISIQQIYKGVPVEGGELKLHAKQGIIESANGRFIAVPKLDVSTNITNEKAIQSVIADFRSKGIYRLDNNQNAMQFMPKKTQEATLCIIQENNTFVLAYRVMAYSDMMHSYVYYIDAKTGQTIKQYKNFCSLHHNLGNHGDSHSDATGHVHHKNCSHAHANTHAALPPDGPATANAIDLKNKTRKINTYESGGTFYMIDASRTMFNAGASDMPNKPVGVIWTIDAFNTNPQNSNFSYDQVKSSNNSWNNKTAVSAHYNGGVAYEYFKNVHQRNSINGEGGNIVSFINISDPQTGGGFDNAFWNGSAMFYGNGNKAFKPLAGALDVAGHEMSHGVVQATANLTYYGESGAMNEAFADIFGAMMDREDWSIGEEVVKLSAFPTGKMRDMANPHNGGTKLGDPGYQPRHYNERYTGTQDNAGVHINSGIVNYAYYLFATTNGVGKDKAEQVYYRALTKYLTKSSNFKDLRAAVEKSCTDLYNATIKDAASAAFSKVGIGAGGGTTDYETDVDKNPGDDFLLTSDANLANLILRNNNLAKIADPLSNIAHISKPSVTDKGDLIFFVGADKKIYYLTIDWENNKVDPQIFEENPVWRNVVISKDGRRIAALTDQKINKIIVYDFVLQQQKNFDLYNPTFTNGVSTGDVNYADAMEFDFTGEWIMYDQESTIQGNGGNITYWDIAFINVFDKNANAYTQGKVEKLFNQLPENTSVGNPTFSKNSSYIIAFDLIQNGKYKVMGANVEQNKVSEMYANKGLGFPNYTSADNQLVYQKVSSFGTNIGLSALQEDKISTQFNSDQTIVENERLPVVFSNGVRDISSAENYELTTQVKLYPNPAVNKVQLSWESVLDVQTIQVFDISGKKVYEITVDKVLSQYELNTENWIAGQYSIVLNTKQGKVVKSLSKI